MKRLSSLLLPGLLLATVMIVIGSGLLADGDMHGGEVLISGVALGLGVWQTRQRLQMVERLDQLQSGLSRLQQGDVHAFLPEGHDAIGRVGYGVNRLMDRLRDARLDRSQEQILDQAMSRESPNGLVVVDQELRIRRCNPSLMRLLSLQGDLTGLLLADIPDLQQLHTVLLEASRNRSASEAACTLGRTDLLLRGVPLADGAGCLGVVLDITTIRLAERARREFVANVSHELRTPITAILGYSESLLEEEADFPPHLAPMLRVIDRNARRLHALVEDVLHLSRIEARTRDLPLERERLAPLVHEVVDRLRSRIEESRLQIVLDLPGDLEVAVNVEAFEHALGNLVDNAIKYSPPESRLRIAAFPIQNRVAIEVIDQGPGIAPEHHTRLFERFYRVDAGRSRAVGGTGLGLALVKNLCAATNSEIQLESGLGEGSTFRLIVPTDV